MKRTSTTYLIASWIAIALLFGSWPIHSAERPDEYYIKAAFLTKFTKFVEWPEEAFAQSKDAIIIGILGKDPFGNLIDSLVQDVSINSKTLKIHRIETTSDIKKCHILFISSSEQKRLPEILNNLQGTNVLTVGEMDRFAYQGGMIRFLIKDKMVRFRVNVEAADQAGLKISSHFLKLVHIVKTVSALENN